MSSKPNKRLSDGDIAKAVNILDGWSQKLTWDHYLSVLAVEIGHRYTKAAMLRHDRIKQAWNAAKARSRGSEGGHGSSALALANQRIRVLEDRVERLQRENDQLLEQFVRWANNAVQYNVTIDKLDKPLPPSGEKSRRNLS